MTTQQVYTYEEAYNASVKYFDGDDLAAKVFVDKYALRNSEDQLLEITPDDMHHRLAREFARIEKGKFEKPLSEDFIYECFKGFKRIVPQGSPMYGIGNPYQYVSIGNCFVLPSPMDSYLGLMYTDTQITQISSRRGGVGWSVSKLRPKGMSVRNAARSTTGAIEFMKRFSNTIREVGQAGRRGASLQCMSIHHPEIVDFIKSKQDITQITGSNISVQFTDEFLTAVENDDEFELRWPVCEEDAKESNRKFPEISTKIKAKEIWDEFINSTWNTSDPGAMFFDTVLRESTTAPYKDYGFIETASNPCITGDTIVYAADGIGNISIKELSDNNKDVNVFCLDNENNIKIRKMRHPRKTGKRVKIYKVLLDDGNYIRCTENHKIRLTDGTYSEAKDLKVGDSLFLVTKFEGSIKDIFPKANSKSQDYIWLKTGVRRGVKSEHRLIAEHEFGIIPKHHVVHHIDYNAQNNSPQNLKIMSTKDHDKLHAQDMLGDKNPMRRAQREWTEEKWEQYREKMSKSTSGDNNGRWYNISNEDIMNHAIHLTQLLGRRFSTKEWQKYAKDNKLPKSFSKFRAKVFKNINNLSKMAANTLNIPNINCDTRLIKTNLKLIEQGYNTKILHDHVLVERTCESCNKKFWIEHNRRESCFCSHPCVITHIKKDKDIYKRASETRRMRENEEKNIKGKAQIEIFLNLKRSLNRDPKQIEWENACKESNIPFRVGKHSRFNNYKNLKEEASNFNHKVVSVTEDGYEDVYNGTVDEFHNFLVGGFEATQENGKKKWHYLCNRQCGEQFLPPYTSCRLICINLYSYVNSPFTDKSEFDVERFKADVKTMQRLADDMVDLEIESINRIIKKMEDDPEPNDIKRPGIDLWKKIIEYSQKDRRTGCGLTGLGDCLAALGMKYDSENAILFCEQMQKTFKESAYESSIEMAEELGPFPIYNKDLDIKSAFIQRIKEENLTLYKRMTKSGRRNMTLLTIAPTGSVSCLTQTSSGLEPVFMLSYMRRKKGNPGDKDFRSDFIDQSGDHWMHFEVTHKGIKDWRKITGKEKIEESPYFGSQAHELDYLKRIELQSKLQKHTDNSLSVTTNLPNNISKEEVSKIYLKAWKSGCKGMTIYRDGCRTGVLVKAEEKKSIITKTLAPVRPKTLPCEIHHATIKGQSYLVVIGLIDGEPYEVFASLNGTLDKKHKTGIIVKERRGIYKLLSLDGELLVESLTGKYNEHEESITRLISTALRHGADTAFVVHQLEKSWGDIQNYGKVIARILKKYIPDNTEVKGEECPECGARLYRIEGCIQCKSCTYSKCG